MANGLFIEEKKNTDYWHLTSDIRKGITITSDQIWGGANSFLVIPQVKIDKIHELYDWVV